MLIADTIRITRWLFRAKRRKEGMAAMSMARRFLLQSSCRFALPVASQTSLLCDCHPHPLRTLSNSMVLRCFTGWWFVTFFSHLLGILTPTDSYSSEGLKPPTSLSYKGSFAIWMGGLDYGFQDSFGLFSPWGTPRGLGTVDH